MVHNKGNSEILTASTNEAGMSRGPTKTVYATLMTSRQFSNWGGGKTDIEDLHSIRVHVKRR